jgi:phosphomannomutase
MSLIKSISGIRGTIGGTPGKGLTPVDVVKFTTAYGAWLDKKSKNKVVVVGRDGRISGKAIHDIVVSTLIHMGFTIIDIGLSTTPTVEMAVKIKGAAGGIIVTASHNPKEWNALKLLNSLGEFISGDDGVWILEFAEKGDFDYSKIDMFGKIIYDDSLINKHIELIVADSLVDVQAIKSKNFKIVLDAINSTGALAVPKLLNALGVSQVIIINQEITGDFSHNPEPLPENLSELSLSVKDNNADLGIAVDPDVDRLAFVSEDGKFFGEEYTLVAVSDYVLSKKLGNTVSNLSSTSALKDITEKYGAKYFASAVGEINVVNKMKEESAVIGGEGNGGVIYPPLHYGRDALIGIALFLTHLAQSNQKVSELRESYPEYVISKNKIKLDDKMDTNAIFEGIKKKYENFPINTEDGLRISFPDGWLHLRLSNTEPIIRIYSEAMTEKDADEKFKHIENDILEIVNSKN